MSHYTKLHLCGIMVCNYKQPKVSIYYDYTVLPQLPIMHTISMCHHTMLWCLLFFWSLWPCHISCTYKQWDGIITTHRSSCKVLLLSNFNQTLICSTVLVKMPNKISQPSGQWQLSLQDRQTDRRIKTNALCSCFSKTTKINHGLKNVSKG